jgi:uncharacterized glyoxalase superfamily protein PhnB/DNA-binding CsgD family transcriptional regulator
VLTPVEWAVLLRVREGLSNAEIAQLRGCRGDTVKYHVANIIGKLELADREALRRWSGRPLQDDFMPGLDLREQERKRAMADSTKAGKVTGVAPFFLVDDVARTAEWYRDALGFDIGEFFREDHDHDEHGNDVALPNGTLGEPVFVIIARNGHRLMLGKTVEPGRGVFSNVDFKEYSGDAYFWCEDVDGIFSQAKAAGSKILLEPETQFYGIREFRLKDCDGRVLTFGAPV